MKKEYWFIGTACGLGALVWILVSLISGRAEAWDSELYMRFGIPTFCALAATFAYFEPTNAWRWGLFPFVGQAVWMFGTQGFGNLWPLGLVAFGVLAIPSIIAARIGASLKNRRRHSPL
jgi:hypothetical protein